MQTKKRCSRYQLHDVNKVKSVSGVNRWGVPIRDENIAFILVGLYQWGSCDSLVSVSLQESECKNLHRAVTGKQK